MNAQMSRFLSAAKRKIKGGGSPLLSDASTSAASLATSNLNKPQEDLYSIIEKPYKKIK